MNKSDILQTLLLCDRPTHKTLATPAVHTLVDKASRTLKRIIAIGGWHADGRLGKHMREYHWDTDEWVDIPINDVLLDRYVVPHLASGRRISYGTALSDGRVFICNKQEDARTNTVAIFDQTKYEKSNGIAEDPYQKLPATIAAYMCSNGISLVTLLDGRVMRIGGKETIIRASGEVVENAIYDPTTGRCTSFSMSIVQRQESACVALNNGEVMITGGSHLIDRPESMCLIYNPDTGGSRYIRHMNHNRHKHAACLLSDGRVFVYGGANDDGSDVSVEIYDPANNTWELRETAYTGTDHPYFRIKRRHMCVQLPTGEIFISSGEMDNEFALFNLETNVIRMTGRYYGRDATGLREVGFLTIAIYE